jgi:hypothetical protein
MEDDDEAQFNAVVNGEDLGSPLAIENDDPEYGPESMFCTYHDAAGYGVLACDCFDYVFAV